MLLKFSWIWWTEWSKCTWTWSLSSLLIIYSFTHLRFVLQTLKDRQLFAMFSKCEYLLQSIAFLHHNVSSEGILVDSQKIEAVKQWTRPTSATYIRSFLGLAGYYWRFVEGFSSIVSPLTKFTQKMVKFQCQMFMRKALQNWKLHWVQLLSWLYQRVRWLCDLL